MGSFGHPKASDAATMESLRAAYYEIYAAIQGQDVFVPLFEDDELRTKIIQKLLDLLTEGALPQDFKSQVLRSLPFR
jgi:hypothetical protein